MKINYEFIFCSATVVFLAACEPKINSHLSAKQSQATSDVVLDLDNDIIPSPSAGYYAAITSTLGPDDVCSDKTIFGYAGAAICNSTLGTFLYSQSYRNDISTVDMTNSTQRNARVVASLAEEVAGSTVSTTNYNLVPNPTYDNDGRYNGHGTGAKKHYLETIIGRPNTTCGTAGAIEVRIADCATKNGARAFYDGRKYGQAGEGDWSLVTFTATSKEVWRDDRTKYLWSDTTTDNYNWFQAAGYSKNASTTGITTYEAGTPASTGKTYVAACFTAGTQTCQPNIPLSVCADATVLAGLNGVGTYQNPDGTNGTTNELGAKGNLSSVVWRLPSLYDWEIAITNGLLKVLPNLDDTFWTGTSGSTDKKGAWLVGGTTGYIEANDRAGARRVRCIGH